MTMGERSWSQRVRSGLTVGLICVALPSLGAAQVSDSARTTATVDVAAQVPNDASLSSVRAELVQLVQQTAQQGQPHAWLIEKMREGVAKGVPAPRIVQAVRVLRDRLAIADGMLQSTSPAPMQLRLSALRALVDGLNAGLSEEHLRGAIDQLGNARADLLAIKALAVTMAELAERGFAPGVIVRATTLAWRSGGVNAVTGVIAVAARIGNDVATRDQALEAQVAQQAQQQQMTPGQGRALGRSEQPGRAESGPPHDDGLSKGQGRALGHSKRPDR